MADDHIPSPQATPAPAPASNHAAAPPTRPAPAAGTQPKPRERAAPPEPRDTLREIAETVVFVVVLVLLLKSFVAEAFVIPTGSMATTLWGYQKVVTCPKCGYEFPVNCSKEAEDGHPIVAGGTCPNCRYDIDFMREHINPPCTSGDRVLVAKYFYDSGLVKPRRLDVVVFKYPEGPQQNWVPMNYIKRLIGLPGEWIAIHGGKLYYLEADKASELKADGARDVDRWWLEYADPSPRSDLLWHAGKAEEDRLREQGAKLRDETRRLFQQGKFQIIRKPPDKILALRRIVHDNDYLDKDQPPRWAGAGAWAADGPHGFRHSGEGQGLEWLRYRHVLRQGPEPELITDNMGYNSEATTPDARGLVVDHPIEPPNWVGDLIVECEVTLDGSSGELALELSKGADRFQARWDLGTGECTLLRLAGGKETKLDAQQTSLKKGKHRLRFANVDDRLCVWVDGSLPFGTGVAYEPPATEGPTRNYLEPASIGVRGSAVQVHGLKVWRDTYYTADPRSADAPAVGGAMRDAQELHKLLSDPDKFAELRDLPLKTLYVQPGHYLCLGDNSPQSSDGRSWGTVPERLMLGRALMVYYPIPLGIWPFNPPVNRFGPIR